MVRFALVVLALCAATACTSDGGTSPSAAPTPSLPTVEAVLDGVALTLEVADEPQERAVGLMGRTEVPSGTGMVFRYDAAQPVSFYMYRVPITLRAVFVRDGAVVSVVDMPPCAADQPGECPTYGPDEPVDTVVEVDPQTLPDVAPGDRLEVND
jgi:uncharacterized membrane protein (UPF0127 family)